MDNQELSKIVEVTTRTEERVIAILHQQEAFTKELLRINEDLRQVHNRLGKIEADPCKELETKVEVLASRLLLVENDTSRNRNIWSVVWNNALQVIGIIIGTLVLYKIGIK